MAGGCKIEWVSSIFFSIAKMADVLDMEIEILRKEVELLKKELQRKKALVTQKTTPPALKEEECKKDVVKLFIESRIREPRTMEEKIELRWTPTKLNELKTRIASWKKENNVELSSQETINALTEIYGEPIDGKYFPLFKVFASDEEVKEWDNKRVEC